MSSTLFLLKRRNRVGDVQSICAPLASCVGLRFTLYQIIPLPDHSLNVEVNAEGIVPPAEIQ